ncbi:MAG: tetratricopeptide repeat protein, partial [Promethearchaeota archaeon]
MSNPNDYNYWFQKAMSGGWFFEDIQRSLRLNPHHIDSWIHYAGYYASSVSENDKTVEILNELLKYKPKEDDSPSLFDHVMQKVKEYTEDDAPMKKVKPNPPYFDSEYIRRYCGEWLIAVAYYWKYQKFSEAYDALKKAISFPRNKNIAILWYFYLVLNLASEQYTKAIEYGEKAVELDPKFKFAWQQLGKSYFRNGDYNQAINCVEKALKLDIFFESALELKKDITLKIEEIKRLEKKKVFSYQRQQLSKEERDFLLDLEKECEKPIPVISEIKWEDVVPNFGFVVKNGHIIELGLTLEAHSVKLIPESISNLKYLEILVIKGIHNLQKFPEGLIFLKNLKYLRYEHCPMPYNPSLNPNSLPTIICNLVSLERLHLDESYITTLPDCLVFLPNLNQINIKCPNLKIIPPVIKEYFEYKEYQRPLRRYLVRNKSSSKKGEISPNTIYNQFLLKRKSEAESIKDLINLIEKSDLLETKIEGIKLLKKYPSKSEEEFKFLKRLMIPVSNGENQYQILQKIITTDPSILIKIAAIEVILYKFADIAYESIKSVIMNEK